MVCTLLSVLSKAGPWTETWVWARAARAMDQGACALSFNLKFCLNVRDCFPFVAGPAVSCGLAGTVHTLITRKQHVW